MHLSQPAKASRPQSAKSWKQQSTASIKSNVYKLEQAYGTGRSSIIKPMKHEPIKLRKRQSIVNKLLNHY